MAQQVEVACRAADRGRFDEAVNSCLQVSADRAEFAACRALMASVYRQVGQHRVARTLDEQALAAPIADPLGRAMCSIGLAADHVGAGDLPGASAAMERASAAVAEVRAWHWAGRWFDPWLTQAWVAAEIALLAGDPAQGVQVLQPFAEAATRPTPTTRWPYERAKTLLFLGVAQRCAGDAETARTNLAEAAELCLRAGLDPLLLPCVEQLALLDPQRAQQFANAGAEAERRLRRHQPPKP